METVLVTGANGEIGHVLLPALAKTQKFEVAAIDQNNLDEALIPFVKTFKKGSILNKKLLNFLLSKQKVKIVFHLAAILSTLAERNPEKAHIVNVNGTSTLLEFLNKKAAKEKHPIKFIFPSTIAVYGLPNLETKNKSGDLKEDQYNSPITMYGINKLYCEYLGIYYSSNYQLLNTNIKKYIDFRCLRFPGLISALTIPTGGTSDYAPEMIHSAAKGEMYESFVRPDTTLPFMVMPDAVKALIQLSDAPKENLSQNVYNVTSFSTTAQQIEEIIKKVFPESEVHYKPDPARQKIVDSWPAAINDSTAQTDWGWKADYDMEKAYSEYLIPEIQNRYKS